jgi:hypothetical protein
MPQVQLQSAMRAGHESLRYAMARVSLLLKAGLQFARLRFQMYKMSMVGLAKCLDIGRREAIILRMLCVNLREDVGTAPFFTLTRLLRRAGNLRPSLPPAKL